MSGTNPRRGLWKGRHQRRARPMNVVVRGPRSRTVEEAELRLGRNVAIGGTVSVPVRKPKAVRSGLTSPLGAASSVALYAQVASQPTPAFPVASVASGASFLCKAPRDQWCGGSGGQWVQGPVVPVQWCQTLP